MNCYVPLDKYLAEIITYKELSLSFLFNQRFKDHHVFCIYVEEFPEMFIVQIRKCITSITCIIKQRLPSYFSPQ